MSLSDGLRSSPGPLAEEGARLHRLAAAVLMGDVALDDLTAEDREIIEPYVTYAEQWDSRVVESCLNVVFCLPVGEQRGYELQGTPDLVAYDDERIVVVDFKTGWRPVEVHENWQLLCYATLLRPTPAEITLAVVQPRPWHPDGPVREWTITAAQLEKYAAVIFDAVRRVHEDAVLRTGPWCRYCPALPHCPAVRDVTLADVDHSGIERVEIPDDFLAKELEVLRSAQERLGLRVAALEEIVTAKLLSGVPIRGVSLEQKVGRLTWSHEDKAVLAAILGMTGRGIGKTVAPTPTQAIKSGVPEQVVHALAKRKPGKLVVSTHSHQAARQAFGKGEQ